MTVSSPPASRGFSISGFSEQSPRLTLQVGTAYTFIFDNGSQHPFAFVTSPTVGGSNELTSAQLPGYVPGFQCAACATNTVTVTPSSATPTLFYYIDEYLGWSGEVDVIP
jgi:hypothetical protein